MSYIENVSCRYELPLEYLSSAAEIYYEAFNEKMKFLIRTKPKGIQLAKELLTTKQCIYAVLNSECVGIATIRFGKYSKRKSTLRIFVRYSGVFRGLSAYFTSLLLDRKVRIGEMRIDNLAVKQNCRRKGIGKALLEKAYQIAKKKDLQKIILEVVDTNENARRLYECEGYLPIETYNYPVIGKFMGYSKSILLEKEVT